MPQYSVEGYVQLVARFRNKPTLLVEGTTDRLVIARVLQELAEIDKGSTFDVIIDHARLIRVGGPRNDREIVERVYAAAQEDPKLACLVDREFRKFGLDPIPLDDQAAHYHEGSLFWTKGHSVENYFFESNFAAEHLKHLYSDSLPSDWRALLDRCFANILIWSAALSFSAFRHAMLQAIKGLADAAWWQEREGELELDSGGITRSLSGRGVSAENAVLLFDEALAVRRKLVALGSEGAKIARWAVHGRLGTELIWSAIERGLSTLGASEPVTSLPKSALTENAYRFFAMLWAQGIRSEASESPSRLFEWLKRATQREAS